MNLRAGPSLCPPIADERNVHIIPSNMKWHILLSSYPAGFRKSTFTDFLTISLHYIVIWWLVRANFLTFSLSFSLCPYFSFIIYSIRPLFSLVFSSLLFLFWTLHGNQLWSRRRAVHSPLPSAEIHRSVSSKSGINVLFSFQSQVNVMFNACLSELRVPCVK